MTDKPTYMLWGFDSTEHPYSIAYITVDQAHKFAETFDLYAMLLIPQPRGCMADGSVRAYLRIDDKMKVVKTREWLSVTLVDCEGCRGLLFYTKKMNEEKLGVR